MGRWRRGLVQKLVRAIDHEAFAVPKGWSVFTRYPTAELKLHYAKPKPPSPQPLSIEAAAAGRLDKQLYEALYAKYPEARMDPLLLSSTRPGTSRRFIERAKQIMGTPGAVDQLRQQQQLQQLQVATGLGGEQQQQQQQQRQQRWPRPQRRHDVTDDIQLVFQAVEREMAGQLEALGKEDAGAGGLLAFIQQQEEAALQAALQQLTARQRQQQVEERKRQLVEGGGQ